jgi:hypothetical protein
MFKFRKAFNGLPPSKIPPHLSFTAFPGGEAVRKPYKKSAAPALLVLYCVLVLFCGFRRSFIRGLSSYLLALSWLRPGKTPFVKPLLVLPSFFYKSFLAGAAVVMVVC